MSEQPVIGERPRLTYGAELMGVLTRDVRRRAANFTAEGQEAIVSFASREDEQPQLYRVTVVPLHRYDEGKTADLCDDLVEEFQQKLREKRSEPERSFDPDNVSETPY